MRKVKGQIFWGKARSGGSTSELMRVIAFCSLIRLCHRIGTLTILFEPPKDMNSREQLSAESQLSCQPFEKVRRFCNMKWNDDRY
jgi:hypothetical protein